MNSLTRIMSYDKTKDANQKCNCEKCKTNIENLNILPNILPNFDWNPLTEYEIQTIINLKYWWKDEKTKNFIWKALHVHGNKYDYSNVIYVKSDEKVEIICRVEGHDPFPQTPSSHLQEHGCKLCGTFKQIQTKYKKYGTNSVHHLYKYDGLYFDSSSELYFYIYYHDLLGHKLTRGKIFEYKIKNEVHYYECDFLLDDFENIEIKGNQFFKDNYFTISIEKYNCIIKNNVTLIKDYDLFIIKYIIDSLDYDLISYRTSKGRKCSEEVKQLLHNKFKGRVFTDEWKKKISESKKKSNKGLEIMHEKNRIKVFIPELNLKFDSIKKCTSYFNISFVTLKKYKNKYYDKKAVTFKIE